MEWKGAMQGLACDKNLERGGIAQGMEKEKKMEIKKGWCDGGDDATLRSGDKNLGERGSASPI
jgi:hypothetical protein